MSVTSPERAPEVVDDDPDQVVHLWCGICKTEPPRSLCGEDLVDTPELPVATYPGDCKRCTELLPVHNAAMHA